MADEEKTNTIKSKVTAPEDQSSKITSEYKSAIFSAYKEFYKLTPEQQAEFTVNPSLTGKQKFREQFWGFLKKKIGTKILENIDKNLFDVYFETISNKKFTLSELTKE